MTCPGEFCDENLELMLEIHEFLREPALESGGVTLPGFSAVERLSRFGRFAGIFCTDDGAAEAGEGKGEGIDAGAEGCWTAGAGSGVLCPSSCGGDGSPPV